MNDKLIGRRFSLVYSVRGEPENDSKKARFRLARLTEQSCPRSNLKRQGRSIDYDKLAQTSIENELGIQFATRAKSGLLCHSWLWYFTKISVSEMLDTITVVAGSLPNENINDNRRGKYLDEARRILKEENLAYEIDEVGQVRPLIDATFSAAMESAIANMDNPRYAASAECLNRIDGHLLQNPQDFIGAIRAVFGACENTFKLMYGVTRLDARTAGERIGRDQQRLYQDHPTLQAASAKTLEAFKQWINAAHFYRHEQGTEAPNQPPAELAVLLVSQGLSFVRWLTMLDGKAE